MAELKSLNREFLEKQVTDAAALAEEDLKRATREALDAVREAAAALAEMPKSTSDLIGVATAMYVKETTTLHPGPIGSFAVLRGNGVLFHRSGDLTLNQGA